MELPTILQDMSNITPDEWRFFLIGILKMVAGLGFGGLVIWLVSYILSDGGR